jgi:hypothetical protein
MEDFAYCPFNKNHSLEKSKLITHINRCKDKRNFPNDKLHKCTKDASYYLDRDLQTHRDKCDICKAPKIDESINISIVNNTYINPNQLEITMILNDDISFNESSFIGFDDKKDNSNIY